MGEALAAFSLNNESFGPFENEETELPEFAAVFLVCRSAATLRENKPIVSESVQ